jgi:tRNA G10  N-methylase Trm11
LRRDFVVLNALKDNGRDFSCFRRPITYQIAKNEQECPKKPDKKFVLAGGCQSLPVLCYLHTKHMVQLLLNMEYAFFLGSNPALSAAEIHDYFKRTGIAADFDLKYAPKLLLVKTANELKSQAIIDNLGGTPMIARIIGAMSEFSAEAIIDELALEEQFIPNKKPVFSLSFDALASSLPDSKTARDVRAVGITIKKNINKKGCRAVLPQTGTALTTAQLFNAGVPEDAVGIHVLRVEKNLFLAMSVVAVQDITFYTRRDRERPEADPGSGMLPVKLAQMFINFSCVAPGTKIYDPFCGVGTIAAEAILQGFDVVASDISPRQVVRTKTNTDWLKNTFPNLIDPRKTVQLFEQDIEKPLQNIEVDSLNAIVSEGWLGPGIHHVPSSFEMENIFVKTQRLLNALLNNAERFLKKDASVVIAIPAFRVEKRIFRAPFLQENLRKFLPKSFVVESLVPENWSDAIFRDASQGMMLYGRPDAIVLRDIIRFKKIDKDKKSEYR